MIQGAIGMIYALSSIAAFCCMVWGIGSAGMNGIRYSSLSTCSTLCMFFTVTAFIASQFLR